MHTQEAHPRDGECMAGFDETSGNTPTEQYNTRARRPPSGQHLRKAGGREEANDLNFAAQEEIMRAASAARWAEDELFHLKNAFDLQLKRLEVERCINQIMNSSTHASISFCFRIDQMTSVRGRGVHSVVD